MWSRSQSLTLRFECLESVTQSSLFGIDFDFDMNPRHTSCLQWHGQDSWVNKIIYKQIDFNTLPNLSCHNVHSSLHRLYACLWRDTGIKPS